jgi:hypothetical protein
MLPTRFTSRVVALGMALAIAGCSLIGSTPSADIPQPVSPQPRAEQLNPGLRPLYVTGAVASVDAIPGGNAALAQGRIGPAVLQLDADSPGGRMWDSGFSEGYSIQLHGLIQLEAGIYGFAALSDDGLRITIGSTRVVDDPLMHVARMSPTTQVTIKEAGWYPISVQYFQVSGAAALRLYWHPPGAGGLLVAPAAILAHQP